MWTKSNVVKIEADSADQAEQAANSDKLDDQQPAELPVTGFDPGNLSSGQLLKYDGNQLVGGSAESFSGDWNDLNNVPQLIEGVDLNKYRSWQNKVAKSIAENDFENGLQQLGYPDGLYFIFVDKSKMSSISGLQTSGELKLYDGSSFYSTNKSASYNDTFDNYQQSYSIYHPEGGVGKVEHDVEITNSSTSVDVRAIFNYSDGSSASATTTVYDEKIHNVTLSNPNPNKTVSWIDLEHRPDDWSSDVYIDNGTVYRPQASSGSFTSVTKDLGYSATKLTLTADYSLNGHSFSLELQDGNGNTIQTISESDIGNTIDIATTATSYRLKGDLNGSTSSSPVIRNIEVGLDE